MFPTYKQVFYYPKIIIIKQISPSNAFKQFLLLTFSNCLLVSGKSENTLSFHRLRINEQMSIINKEENAHTYALRIKRERERERYRERDKERKRDSVGNTQR